jgi:hypothetical protein
VIECPASRNGCVRRVVVESLAFCHQGEVGLTGRGT